MPIPTSKSAASRATNCAGSIELLNKLEELVRVIQRRGIDFADFLSQRDIGRPAAAVSRGGRRRGLFFALGRRARCRFLAEQNLW